MSLRPSSKTSRKWIEDNAISNSRYGKRNNNGGRTRHHSRSRHKDHHDENDFPLPAMITTHPPSRIMSLLDDIEWKAPNGTTIKSIILFTSMALCIGARLSTLGWIFLKLPTQSSPPSSISYKKQSNSNIHILTTNYGWDHPDKTVGLTFGRSIRQAELWEGIKAQPEYWEGDWMHQSTRTIVQQNDRNKYFVFLDVETCFESEYPLYIQNMAANSDLRNGRKPIPSSGGLIPKLRSLCPVIDAVLNTPMFQSAKNNNNNNNTRLVLFDCRPWGPKSCLSRRDNPRLDDQVSIISLSAAKGDIVPGLDIGLPPPAVTRVHLNTSEVADIENCVENNRPYLFTFVGSFRNALRSQLNSLVHNSGNNNSSSSNNNNNNDVLIMDNLDRLENSNSLKGNSSSRVKYQQLLSQSQFSAVPRGDNLYSYRFTEVFSSGAIPVILADEWVLPLCSKVIGGGSTGSWEDLVVIIPENQVASTIDILRNITLEKRCQMRKRAYQFYNKYLSSPEATMAGIIDCLS